MIEAVIFDLDGVLVTTDEFHYLAWKDLAESIGITDFTKEDKTKGSLSSFFLMKKRGSARLRTRVVMWLLRCNLRSAREYAKAYSYLIVFERRKHGRRKTV